MPTGCTGEGSCNVSGYGMARSGALYRVLVLRFLEMTDGTPLAGDWGCSNSQRVG